jgi:hypothetical protein
MSSSIRNRSSLKINQPFLALSYKTSSNFFYILFVITVNIIHPNKKSQIFLNIYISFIVFLKRKKNGKQIAKTFNGK